MLDKETLFILLSLAQSQKYGTSSENQTHYGQITRPVSLSYRRYVFIINELRYKE